MAGRKTLILQEFTKFLFEQYQLRAQAGFVLKHALPSSGVVVVVVVGQTEGQQSSMAGRKTLTLQEFTKFLFEQYHLRAQAGFVLKHVLPSSAVVVVVVVGQTVGQHSTMAGLNTLMLQDFSKFAFEQNQVLAQAGFVLKHDLPSSLVLVVVVVNGGGG